MSETNPIPTPRKRVLSGMRPTGKLHLGNYIGALQNWVKLQNEVDEHGNRRYECYFFIADFHALTTEYADTSRIKQNTLDVALDFLAAGLDPDISTIFIQSHVPQHAELHLLLSMITPLSWLERVPSYKDQQEQLRQKDLATYGFLGYPLLQSADILIYQPDYVPVGQDQVAHVELTREVARRFNILYCKQSVGRDDQDRLALYKKLDILPEPQVLVTASPKLPGLDGRKMSKSYSNTISLSDRPRVVLQKIASMSNGGQRLLQSDPGDPERCPVGDMHRVFSNELTNQQINNGCRTAALSCKDCKNAAGRSIVYQLEPIQQRRAGFEENPEAVLNILEDGAVRANSRAAKTMTVVKAAMGISRELTSVSIEHPISKDLKSHPEVVHDLSSKLEEWWESDRVIRSQLLRNYWKTKILPPDIVLTRDSDRVFITQHSKRVYVTTSRELADSRWIFEAQPKSYELLVLLCWEKSGRLWDFAIPQRVYVQPWSSFKKKHRGETIKFSITKVGHRFALTFPETESIDVSEFWKQPDKYDAMR